MPETYGSLLRMGVRLLEAKEISNLAHIIYCGRPGFIENNNKEEFHMTDIGSLVELEANKESIGLLLPLK